MVSHLFIHQYEISQKVTDTHRRVLFEKTHTHHTAPQAKLPAIILPRMPFLFCHPNTFWQISHR